MTYISSLRRSIRGGDEVTAVLLNWETEGGGGGNNIRTTTVTKHCHQACLKSAVDEEFSLSHSLSSRGKT